MLFFTFLSRHKLAGRFVLRSRRCLRLWSLLPSFAAHKLRNPKAVRLLTNQVSAFVPPKERAALCALNHL
jgi:hypothetical protein